MTILSLVEIMYPNSLKAKFIGGPKDGAFITISFSQPPSYVMFQTGDGKSTKRHNYKLISFVNLLPVYQYTGIDKFDCGVVT